MTAATASLDPSTASAMVTDEARRDLLSGAHRAVVVDSPPGAGKSTFVVATAIAVAGQQGQTPVVAQTNAQADDLCRSLLRADAGLEVGRLVGTSGSGLARQPRLGVERTLSDLSHCDVVVATAAKWTYAAARATGLFDIGIVDEAYQMRSDQLLFVAPVFDHGLFVGDPGQLDPFTPIDDSRWRGHVDGPINPAVATVLHSHPDSPVHKLPVSWRLPVRGAPLVSEAFYPSMPFRAGTTEDQRQLRVRRVARSVLDRAIRTAADSGWAFLELPHRVAPPTDREAIETVAALVIRLLTADIEVHDHVRTPASAPLAAHRIAVGAAHRSQRAAIRLAVDRHSRSAGVDATDVVVDTANRLQGREYDVGVVLHPLSGRAAASEFHLETGRLCVLLSRHRQACIVVGRAGIADVLDAHPGAMPVWLGARIAVPDGWEANQVVLERLQAVKVPAMSTAR